jgi:hypothetical protein
MKDHRVIGAVLVAAVFLAALPAAAQVPEQAAAMRDPGFHLGADLSIHQPLDYDIPALTPKLEAGLIVARFVDIYLALGLDVLQESAEEEDDEFKAAAGTLLTELGVRFIFGEPRPGHAFFYGGFSLTPVIGIASYESDEDEDFDEDEDSTKETLDRIDVGLNLGLEYLATRNFGVGAETGFVMSFNNLKGTHEEEPDKHLRTGFFIPFTIRMAYHF